LIAAFLTEGMTVSKIGSMIISNSSDGRIVGTIGAGAIFGFRPRFTGSMSGEGDGTLDGTISLIILAFF
jgi:hypothetical protein